MAKELYHFKGFSKKRANIEIEWDTTRLNRNLNKAQYALDSAVMASMEPFMPSTTGGTSSFVQVTKEMSGAIAGTGKVVAAAPPYGRYLYMGKVMVDSQTGKGPMKITDKFGNATLRFRKGAKLKATDRPLKYSRPGAQAKWFDAAKKKDSKEWVRVVEKELDKK